MLIGKGKEAIFLKDYSFTGIGCGKHYYNTF